MIASVSESSVDWDISQPDNIRTRSLRLQSRYISHQLALIACVSQEPIAGFGRVVHRGDLPVDSGSTQVPLVAIAQ